MPPTNQVPERSEIPKEQTWNAESVFASFDAWRAEYDAVRNLLPEVEPYQGQISSSPEKLVDWMDFSSKISRRIIKLYFYTSMWLSCDSDNETVKGLQGQVMSLYGQYAAKSAFESPELLAMDESTLRSWVAENDSLNVYQQHIDDLLRQKDHVRSTDVEAIMGMVSEPFSGTGQTRQILTNTDMKFSDASDTDGKAVAITQSNMDALKGSTDRELRRTAWNSYADSHLDFKNTLAQLYLTSVKQNVMQARVRGYETVLESRLSPFNIPVEVFHNLIDTYKANIPTWHRYWDVRRRALGYDSIHPYDIWAPLTDNDPPVSFEDAVNMIAGGMQPLGEDYVNTFRKGCLEERWVDYSVNIGKRQGAFSGGTYDTYPFIMMSFDNSLGAMSTLAHELGHSMHSYNSRETQPYVYSGYSMFVAEVASNFNQAMVRAHLFEQDNDRDFELALIQEAMDNLHRYFFIMPTLARFEYDVHTRIENGEPVTPDTLNQIMSDFYAEGYGDTMTDDSTRTGITWAQFNHLYVPYYTFQYATGISAAHALANGILAGDDPQAVDRYLTFLKAGSSDYPINVLNRAGVDMSTPKAVEETFTVLSSLVDRLESLTQ
jgi:oligoendopeptidase F